MRTVNSSVIHMILSILDSVSHHDPGVLSCLSLAKQEDVEWLIRKYILPDVQRASSEGQSLIYDSLAYYSRWGHPPFEIMYDNCHDVDALPPDDWRQFVEAVGRALYGDAFKAVDSADGWVEKPGFTDAQNAFSFSRTYLS